ncbi:MAG: IS30 family transposase [Clostridia bacterium]|nr:IS30 family transposase [Clostridia bacterium]
MSQGNYSTGEKKKKHLTERDRYKIEALAEAKRSTKEISKQIGCSQRTIQRELQRGKVTQLNSGYEFIEVYKADVGQRIHDERAVMKGRSLKIGKEHGFAARIEQLIVVEKYSPDAAIAQCAKENNGRKVICTRTLYAYIWNDLFYGIGEECLPRGKRKSKHQARHRRVALNNTRGRSIEERTQEINERREEGHWELDTVVGKPGTKACLMVMTERKKNLELVFRLASKSEACVVQVLDRLEKKLGYERFREVFKSITCDNGCENLDMHGMERSALREGKKRTTIYYAHPYSAYERGANEGANVLIRRFVPKGTDIGKLSRMEVKRIAHWMNHYPRRKLDYASAFEASQLAAVLAQRCVI